MEATALWDFEANQPDEMSFKKGTRLCVLDVEEKEWCKAVWGTQSGLIPATYIQITEPANWFLGSLRRLDAEAYLLIRDRENDFIYPDGSFLIRKSESDTNGFALSVKHQGAVQHFKILRDSRNKFYIWPNTVFSSINQLVAAYHEGNVAGDQARQHIQLVHVEMYEASYDFTPANQEELELRRGDVIQLISKADQNWWEGYCCRRKGFFPMNYVKIYEGRY